jgi:hypothetical protein
MYTLPNEVEAFDLPFVIEKFKLKDPLKKQLVGALELRERDLSLVEDPYSDHQFTVVRVILFREYPIEEPGSQTIEIEKELPSLVSARDLFRGISRRTVEGAREIGCCVRYSLSVGRPDVPFQDSPRPDSIWVSLATAFTVAPKIKHQSGEVNDWLMHEVARETSRWREDAREALENRGLSDASLQSSLRVTSVVIRGDNIIQILSVSEQINRREVCNVDISMITR